MKKVKQLLHGSTASRGNKFLLEDSSSTDAVVKVSVDDEGNGVDVLATDKDHDEGVSYEIFGALDSVLPSLDEVDADDLSTEVHQMRDYIASLKYLETYLSSKDFSDLIDKSPIEKKDVRLVLDELVSGKDVIESIQELLSEYLDEDEVDLGINLVSTSPRKLKDEAKIISYSLQEGNNSTAGRRLLLGSEQSFGNYYSRSINSHRQGQGYSGYFDRIVNENQGHQGTHIPLMHDQHEDKTDHRKLLSIANDGSEDQCVLIDDDTHKRNQCSRLAQCGQNYNLYDLFIFMFGDDIDFETGTIDDKIVAFDERSFREKVRRKKNC